uniref:ATPase, F1/V1/A1 complex, alpha/beta subunit, zinc knuckle CX2CX4HX4C n=1 Tax=Tanacetum cinerariifolium TaxID=118510 RepID=A0A6L2KFI3_TANCI|nr:ATPase, F1/V1/A1 complex, alpha/beta subunit, zinc knuckle CX2CX4HX4C [Tanacetum cinerariifolium]
MFDNTKKAQCIHCLHFFSKDFNSTLKNHISYLHCEALKRAAELGQSSMSRDESLFVYNPDVLREQFAGLVIQRGLPFNHFDDEQTTRVFQKHLQPKYNHVTIESLGLGSNDTRTRGTYVADGKHEEPKSQTYWFKKAFSATGLSLITTQLGRPIRLDACTSDMCINPWGRNSYARVLVELSSKCVDIESIVVAIPLPKDEGHYLETLDVEWWPPKCKFFDHEDDYCPAKLKKANTDASSGKGVGKMLVLLTRKKVGTRLLIRSISKVLLMAWKGRNADIKDGASGLVCMYYEVAPQRLYSVAYRSLGVLHSGTRARVVVN